MKRALSILCLACSIWGADSPGDAKIQIRLKTKVTSNTSKPHDSVEAMIIQPVTQGNQTLIPLGAIVRGEVVQAAPAQATDQRATLQLNFNQLVGPRNRMIAISTKLSGVDNARESVDESGVVQGIVASESLSNRMDTGISKLSERAGGLADILQLAKGKLLKTTDSEIDYEPGAEMTLTLTARPPAEAAQAPGVQGNLRPAVADPALQRMVNAQPFQTIAEKPPKPSDRTNLMFIGSKQELINAFAAAGWKPAATLTKSSGFETFAAIAEQRGYNEAPMSILLLENRPADLNYQKQNNTFSKRHHLRIWLRPQWQGRDVWVSSATHDIGIDFSAENRTFIHKVDSNIDDERAKVLWDLVGTGMVKSWMLVDRPNVPKEGMNATGDQLRTDGKMAVLMLGQ